MQYTYLLINFFTILFPIALSFEKKVCFSQYWKYLAPATIITTFVFIVWDHFFTLWGVWHFNPEYIVGLYLWGLPVEEWLFFITVPYACVFSYQVVNYYIVKDIPASALRVINLVLITGLIAAAFYNYDKAYTFSACFFNAAYLLYLVYRKAPFLGKFYVSYLFTYVMFLLVNGILTALPVVIYNNAENTGIRIITIPVEDSAYGMLMLIMNVSLMEYFYFRKKGSYAYLKAQRAL
jgi:lycopene cyclase domain-containing protein